MQPETKFLRLRTPVTIGSRFGDWVVTWLGGWTRDGLSYIAMVVKFERLAETTCGNKPALRVRPEFRSYR
jgi:hypothetical protein